MSFEVILTILVALATSIISIISLITLITSINSLIRIRKELAKKSLIYEIDIKDASGKIIETRHIPQSEAQNFMRMLKKSSGDTSFSAEQP